MRRILPINYAYPFVIKDPNFPGFRALIYDISKKELENFDYYEGIDVGLYIREKILASLPNGNKKIAFIYLPSEKTINQLKLNIKIDENDNWRDVIKNNPEIIRKFPDILKNQSF